MNAGARSGWWLLGWLLSTAAHAGCSRPINAPMAPIGLSVSFDEGRALGIYPTLLRELAATTQCQFEMHKVPRARLQSMFDAGQADLVGQAGAERQHPKQQGVNARQTAQRAPLGVVLHEDQVVARAVGAEHAGQHGERLAGRGDDGGDLGDGVVELGEPGRDLVDQRCLEP